MSQAHFAGSSARAWRWRFTFFSLLLIPLLPAALLALAHRLWLRRRSFVGLRDKLTGNASTLERLPSADRPASAESRGFSCADGPVLVHGVSLGEVALMRPLVPRLEAALGARCVLTTSTETGWQGLEKYLPSHARAFLPFDLPWAVTRFLRRVRPRAVVLLEAEFWPLLLCACFLRGIPVVLVNARVSPRSFVRFTRARALISPLFRAYAAAVAQNGLYAARLRALGCAVAVPVGSMKADMVRLADAAACDAEGARVGLARGEPLLLLASTSDGEEARLLDAWPKLNAWPKETAWRIVITPRHPERGPALERLCAERGLRAVRSSTGGRISEKTDVLIVDEIGRLGALYGWCARENGIAVVGGSFGSGRGGQNMFEAAAARCATVVGWDARSQPDAMSLLRACAGVVEITAVADLAATLAALADDPARRVRLGDAGHQAWLAGQGATERVVRVLSAALLSRQR